MNAAELQVAVGSLRGIAEEMGAALIQSALSPNIKERQDCSTALFDADGNLVIQAEHIPVHIGAMPASVAAVRERDPAPGDVWCLNDPFSGGSHLPDITLVSPIHVDGTPIGFAASRAHHADVGGMAPGSMPADSRDLQQEGLVIPPIRLIKADRLDEDLLTLISSNSRMPAERIGDLRAQMAVHRLAQRRTEELCATRGLDWVLLACREVHEYAERRTRAAIKRIPDGSYTARETVETLEGELELQVSVEVAGDEITIDFDGSSEQYGGNLNCPLAVTKAACYFVVRVLTDPDGPASGGAHAPVHVTAPLGTLLNPRPPCAVVAGNVETSSRITDCVMRAFAGAVETPAQGQGTMNNITLGNSNFTYYETIGGGQGASATGPGPSGVHVAMSNTLNTPVEALEAAYPLRVERYAMRRGSGGRGRHRGGEGVIRSIVVLEPCDVSILSDRRVNAPHGACGGAPGATGRNTINSRSVGAKVRAALKAGDVVTIVTPGGGGFGLPRVTAASRNGQ
jgi:N-methylhydantoinase B